MKTCWNRIAERIVSDDYVKKAKLCFSDLMPIVLSKYEELFGEQGGIDDDLDILVTENGLPEGKVGAFKMKGNGRNRSVLIVSPGAFSGERAPYWFVIAHELIHAVLKNPDDPHDGRFDAMAEAMRIPQRYRD